MNRRLRIAFVLAAMTALSGCGTPYATIRTPAGEELMLLGHDPVAYFTMGKAVRGDPKHRVTLPDRTYYFASEQHKKLFAANPGTARLLFHIDSGGQEEQILSGLRVEVTQKLLAEAQAVAARTGGSVWVD